jgi:hypothetical protein
VRDRSDFLQKILFSAAGCCYSEVWQEGVLVEGDVTADQDVFAAAVDAL